MAKFNFFYPSSSASANPSVGSNGVTAPTSSTEVAGINPSGNLQPLQTDASGALITVPATGSVQHVIVDSSALPTGAATQTTLATVSTTLGSILLDLTNGTQITQITGTVPLPTGAATSANQSTEIASLASIDGKTPALGQALAAASVPVVLTAAQLTTLTPLTSVTVTQATGTNLHAVIDNFPATQPISGSVTVTQATGTNLHAVIDSGAVTVSGTVAATQSGTWTNTVTQATGTNLHTVVDSGSIALSAAIPAGTNNIGKVNALATTPTAGTVSQAAITVGTSAVRLTVSGSAPNAARSVLVVTPDSTSTATFYIGSSSVTNSGATRGIQILAGQTFTANSDAADYYIISSTAAQTVYVMEQA